MNLIPAVIRRRIAHRPNLVKIVDNIGWLFFDKILRMGVGLVVGVWIARYLGPAQFGLLNFAVAVIGLFGVVAGLGLQGIVVRDLVRDRGSKEEILGTAAALQFVGGLIAYAAILATIVWLRPDDTLARAIVVILGSMMMFKVSDVAVYWFESQVLSKYTVWVQNGTFLIFAAIKVILILQTAPLIAFAWAMTAEALIVAILLLIVFHLRGPRLRQVRATLKRAKWLLKDSWPLFLSSIAVVIYMKIDQIMLGQIVGNEAVGIYSAAVRISEVWYFVPMAIVMSVFPSILDAKMRSEQLYYERLQQLYDLMVWLSIAVAVPMTFLGPPIIVLLFGDPYVHSGQVLVIHIWAAIFVSLSVASGKWFIAENRQILSLQRHALGAALNLLLNFILIPQFSASGAAIATIISYAFAALFFDIFRSETRQMFFMKMNAFNLLRAYKILVIRKNKTYPSSKNRQP